MEFFTKINIPASSFSISHQDKLLLIGSCFTENIGNYLRKYQFRTNVNPFGIIYNPVSIFGNLKSVIDKKAYSEQDLLQHNELYVSLDHHGQFSGIKKNKVLSDINTTVEKTHADFKATNHIIITLGTAFVYRHLERDRVVANCHKIANTAFEKSLLTINEIKTAFHAVRHELKDKKVLFTVSPVRHWREGAVENQRSKSILIESIHQLIAENDNCFYFPAYEIMMDELRDYRFYSEDMLHPNEVAVKYIWDRFAETYFDTETQQTNTRIEKINLLLQHRVKNENTKEQKAFNNFLAKSLSDFHKDYPILETDFPSSNKTGNSI